MRGRTGGESFIEKEAIMTMGMGKRSFAVVLLATLWSASFAFAAEYQVINVPNGATIKGTAKWKMEVPKLPPLKVFKHMETCGQQVPSPVLQIDPSSKGVKFVTVYIEKIEAGKGPDQIEILHSGKSPTRPESQVCNFEEHVFPFEHKAVMGFQNFEKVLHVPHGFTADGGTVFSVALPNPGQMVKHPEPRVLGVGLRYQCETHVHMNGWIHGFDHPYFENTDAKGNYEITSIPPGKYTVIAWHEGYNIKAFDPENRPQYDEPHIIKKEIEVKAGEMVTLDFEFPSRDVKVDWKIAK
jgi:hypothetical protein